MLSTSNPRHIRPAILFTYPKGQKAELTCIIFLMVVTGYTNNASDYPAVVLKD